MSILNLDYKAIGDHMHLYRGREEIGRITIKDFEAFRDSKTDQEPSIQLHPSQYTIEEVSENAGD